MPACSIIVWGARGWQLTLALLFVVYSLTVDFSRGDSGDGSCPNRICANTSLCCSQYGYCGPSSLYCGTGCQSGPCLSKFAPTNAPASAPAASCGPNNSCAGGLCCSKYGYCGPSSLYCGSGCQSGPCLSKFAPTNAPTSAPAGSCGPNNSCAGGLCCSQYGYCGSTPAYCGCGCQGGPCSTCNSSGGKSRLSSGAIAGIVIGPTVVALALVGGIFFVAWRRSRRNTKEGNILVQDLETKSFDNGSGKGSYDPYDPYGRQMSLSESFSSTLSSQRKRLSGEMLHVATNGFSDELGRGAFGIVYKGKLEDGTEIAVKKLLDGRRDAKDFEAEVKTLGSINHSNLVALLGFTLERNQLFLIYEFVAKGSLDKWIFAHEKADVDFVLPWEARVGIVKGTAKGLAYLHGDLQGGKSIIHLDIKPQNILLDESWAPKIADFGLAKLLGSETTRQTLAAGGTMGYMAPEVYVGVASPKMDVYSFGMVLLEVVCGRESVFESASPDSLFLPAWTIRKIKLKEQLDVVDPLLQGQYDGGLATKFIRIALLCLQRDPDERPEMSSVLSMMDGIVAPQDLPLTLQSEFEMAEKLIRGRVTKDASINFIEFSGDSWKHKKQRSAGAAMDRIGLEGVADGARSI